MKTRHGFVSNSSSSSFVVAFPSKPKTVDEVMEMMFAGQEGGVNPWSHTNGLSHTQIANYVLRDIKETKAKKPSLKKLVDVFEGRYHYSYEPNYPPFLCAMNNTHYDGEGYWYGDDKNPYFGADKETLEKLRQMTIAEAKRRKEIDEAQRRIMETCPIKRVPFAYEGGKNHKTGKKYTKKQIEAYKKNEAEISKWQKEHAEYQRLNEERQSLWKNYEKQRRLTRKIARADAKKFLEDHPDAFIFETSYSDNDGEHMSIMEHGNIFKNLPHVRVSHH